PTPDLWVVLVSPPVALAEKTRRLYDALGPNDFSSGDTVRGLAATIERGGSLAAQLLPSGFSRAAVALAPEVRVAMDAIRSFGGWPSLCGAGPTVLSLHADAADARLLAQRSRTAGFAARVARTRESDEEPAGC
ncbi:MAG TPA: hypothetical protein VFZ25_02365, partial [Chloroflexota bacterium]|nr:hypothetical protein [Chloroflexota bacterium]